MNILIAPSAPRREIVYPESDGLPMADNTKQLRWIVTIYSNLAALFRQREDVFVTSNVFWYPVEGEPELRVAPDVFLVFGRPKGDRSSYKQWEEGGVPVTVAFEILSPGKSVVEMIDKQFFYEDHGVEEYYIYDPDHDELCVLVRKNDLLRLQKADGFVSHRLGIRFDLSGEEMVIWRPDGKRFLTIKELGAMREESERLVGQLEEERERLVRLAELSRKARRGNASADELRDLEQLENDLSPP